MSRRSGRIQPEHTIISIYSNHLTLCNYVITKIMWLSTTIISFMIGCYGCNKQQEGRFTGREGLLMNGTTECQITLLITGVGMGLIPSWSCLWTIFLRSGMSSLASMGIWQTEVAGIFSGTNKIPQELTKMHNCLVARIAFCNNFDHCTEIILVLWAKDGSITHILITRTFAIIPTRCHSIETKVYFSGYCNPRIQKHLCIYEDWYVKPVYKAVCHC